MNRKIPSFVIHWILLFLGAILLGLILGFYIPFSVNTLFWMTSSIIQAFGAMIAIILAIGLQQRKIINEKFEMSFKGLHTYYSTISELKSAPPEAYKIGLDQWKEIKNEYKIAKTNILKQLEPAIQSIAVLIASALLILMFTHYFEEKYITKPEEANILISIFLTFLLLTSLYCLQLLINRIYGILRET